MPSIRGPEVVMFSAAFCLAGFVQDLIVNCKEGLSSLNQMQLLCAFLHSNHRESSQLYAYRMIVQCLLQFTLCQPVQCLIVNFKEGSEKQLCCK
jgi:hypothetical protein